jgi:acetate---CoA ligase (ADP-forming)
MNLERLLRPKSIAAIGGLQASRVVEQCQLMGYEGDIWPVHPSKTEIHGLKVYPSVEALPGAPDAAFIGVNRQLTIDVVKALRDKECGGAICYASGFRESDETGVILEKELIEAAVDMPVLGPNCYGLINYANGALLWPDQQGGSRLEADQNGVAIIAQSSNIAINFTMQQRGLPLAFVMTVGNQAIVGLSEIALNLLDNPRVTTLGIYVEGFDSIANLEKLAAKSRRLDKPIVVFKVGKSKQSQTAALTHTASLAGSYSVTSAFLKRYGFGQAESIPVFLETLKLLHIHGPLEGYRLSSMSCSGGEASIIADAAHERRVYFPELTTEQKAPVEKALGPLVTVANPLDYHTYCWGNREVMESAYAAMVGNRFDLNFLVLDFPHRQKCEDWEWHIAVDAFEAALKKQSSKGAFVISMPENISEDYAESFAKRGLVSLYGFNEALAAAEIAADIGEAWKRTFPEPIFELQPITGSTHLLNEADAKQQLKAHQLPVPASVKLTIDTNIEELVRTLKYPLVLKALGIAHKSEQNAVRLNLNSITNIHNAADDLFKLSDSLYLEEMVSGCLMELLIGITRDPQFGLVLTLASGGVLVELLKDSKTLILPATREEIIEALQSLKTSALLEGFRGKPAANMQTLLDAIMSVQSYAITERDRLIELDINPLMVTETQIAVAADALIVLNSENR